MASITTAQRAELVTLTVAMFNAAPGANYLSSLVKARENGASVQSIADALASKPLFEQVYPAHLTSDEFADKLMTNLLGNEVTDAAAKTWVKDWIKGQLAAGKTPAQVIVTATTALSNTTNAAFTNAKTALTNKVDVATYYSVTKAQSSDDLLDLQAPLTAVTSSAASVTAAKAKVDTDAAFSNGEVQALTLDQDSLIGTAGNDIFNANALNDGTTLVTSLQSEDSIDGSDGVDGLFVTSNVVADIASPTLVNVENIYLRAITNAGSGIDLSAATGVQKVIAQNGSVEGLATGVGAVGTVGIANQTAGLVVEDSTATTLAVELTSAGNTTTAAALEVTGSAATTLNVTTSASNAQILGTAATTTVSVNSTGANTLDLKDAAATLTSVNATGTGSVDLTKTALTAVTTLTAGDGGIKFSNGAATATLTATTGAGADTLTILGSEVGTVNTGGGKDSVTVATDALAATAVINVGAGDDTVTLIAASAGGATLTGGDGTDTLAMTAAIYTTVSGLDDEELDLVTGFETLSITDALDAATIDVSKIAGIVSAQTVGVATTKAATISNIGANANVILKGATGTNDGTLTVTLKDDSGSADILNVTVNQTITQTNNGATVDKTDGDANLVLHGIETVNVNSTGTATPPAAGSVADVALNTIKIVNDDLVTLNISGNQSFSFTEDASSEELTTVNASSNTGTWGNTINLAAHAGDAGVTVTGSAGVDTITGSAENDTISAGAGADVIRGGIGADALTGGAGNDLFVLGAANESTLVDMDIIADFTANTYGNGTDGASGTGANADVKVRTGDVIQLDVTDTSDGVFTFVAANASDATTFLQNLAADVSAAKDNAIGAALDTSTNRLYIDLNYDGTADSVIQLTGVTTITAAAFALV